MSWSVGAECGNTGSNNGLNYRKVMNCYQFRDLRRTTKIRYAYVNRTPNRSKRNFSRINDILRSLEKDRRRNSVKANKPSTSKKR